MNRLQSMMEWIQQNREWVFSGVGVAIISGFVTWFRLRHRNAEQLRPKLAKVSVASGAIVSGNVAGRDMLVISADRTQPNLEELARICEQRALEIQRGLQQHYQYSDVREWLEEFTALHRRHVEALRAGRVIEAHETLIRIHKHSYQLECQETGTRLSRENPGVDYAMLSDFGQRGPMIAGYVTGEIMRNSKKYATTVEQLSGKWFEKSQTEENALLVYRLAFGWPLHLGAKPRSASPASPTSSTPSQGAAKMRSQHPLSMVEKNLSFSEELPIGWVDCPTLEGAPRSRNWRPERGFRYALLLVTTSGGKKHVVRFDATRSQLCSTSGQLVRPCGVAPCLSKDFRAKIGQKVPLLLSTDHVEFEQEGAECFGILYCIPKGFVPASAEYHERTFSDIAQLEWSGVVQPSSGETRLTIRTECRLRDPIPFSFEEGSLKDFTVFEAPYSRKGIIAIGPRISCGIVVIRVPLENAKCIDTDAIRAYLRDGSVLPAKGIILPVSQKLTLADKAILTKDQRTLKPGGTANFLTDYAGPVTYFDELDCKIVVAFDSRADWQSVIRVEIGGYVTKFENGTLVY